MGRRKWRTTAMISVGVMLAMLVVVISLALAVVQDGLKLRKAIQLGVGVTNTHAPLVSLSAPPIPADKKTLDARFARYASDILVRLESSVLEPPEGMQTVQVLDTSTGRNNAWVLKNADQLWIVFRGTATKQEWEKDFEFKQVPFLTRMLNKNISKLTYPKITEEPQVASSVVQGQGVQVHSGFLDVYMDMRDALMDSLKDAPAHICITGHSLGGAMAQLALNDIAATTPQASMNTVVFGSPRVGNQAFASQINALPQSNHFVMIANTSDLVTDIPLAVQPTLVPSGQPLLYVHPENTHSFTDNTGTWIGNHVMAVYVDYLDSQL
jgi:hypothetical protein